MLWHYVTEWWNDSPDQAHADAVSVALATETGNINAALGQSGYITGTVTATATPRYIRDNRPWSLLCRRHVDCRHAGPSTGRAVRDHRSNPALSTWHASPTNSTNPDLVVAQVGWGTACLSATSTVSAVAFTPLERMRNGSARVEIPAASRYDGA